MRSICFYFQVHQPLRLRTYRFFDIGAYHNYYDDYQNKFILKRVAEKCYKPMNDLLLELFSEYGSKFRVSFSLSGVVLDQFEMYAPDVLESFQKLASTGNVEFLAETYNHSLSSLKSADEFKHQVNLHREKIEKLFGQRPTTFRNTELIYSDEIGSKVAEMGFETILSEGAKHVLGWKSPNFLYCNAINPKLKVLLRNFRMSDDIAFRFSNRAWTEWPLTAEKMVNWLNAVDTKEEVLNLFMDYETFGEHQWPETGIFKFMKALPKRVFSHSDFTFNTPAEVSGALQPVSAIHVEYPISWADEERDLTAWLGNELQDDAYENLYALEDEVNSTDDPEIRKDWKYLQGSDHFYYMCTKWFTDGDVHKYFNPFGSPYDAYINYMNVIADFRMRLESELKGKHKKQPKDIGKELKDTYREAEKKVRGKARELKSSASKKIERSGIKEMTLEDLATLSNAKIKEILKKIDLQDLAAALKDTRKEVAEKVMPNLSAGARKKWEEIQKDIRKIKKTDLPAYRSRIEKQLRKIKF